MKKYLFRCFVLFFFFSNVITAQEIALTTEVSRQGGLIYYKGKPFTGKLYEYNENAKTKCSCTKEFQLSNGVFDGKAEEWYVTGQKRYEGLYDRGQKEGKHTLWTATGLTEFEETYHKGNLALSTIYYLSGNKKEYKEYDLADKSVKIHKKYIDNPQNGLLSIINYSKGNFHGEQIYYFENGNQKSYENYNNGNLIENKVFAENGNIIQKNIKINKHNYIELFNEEGEIKESKFFLENAKDSIWITYNADGEKTTEQAFKNNKLTRKGQYVDNQKSGEWNYNFSDGDTQKTEIYDNSGNLVKTETIKASHLISRYIPDNNKRSLFVYTSPDETKEFVIVEKNIDNSDIEQKINTKIIAGLSKRLKTQIYSEALKKEMISKKIDIENIHVTYNESNYKTPSNTYEKKYDAFIHFTLKVFNADNELIGQEEFKINKSSKLLNSLLNAATGTYAKSREEAFNRSLEQIEINEFLYKFFPIQEDIDKKGKKRKK